MGTKTNNQYAEEGIILMRNNEIMLNALNIILDGGECNFCRETANEAINNLIKIK